METLPPDLIRVVPVPSWDPAGQFSVPSAVSEPSPSREEARSTVTPGGIVTGASKSTAPPNPNLLPVTAAIVEPASKRTVLRNTRLVPATARTVPLFVNGTKISSSASVVDDEVSPTMTKLQVLVMVVAGPQRVWGMLSLVAT